MAMTWEDVKTTLNSKYSNDESVKHCWDLAVALVDRYCGSQTVPVVVKEEAYFVTAIELYDRRKPMDNVGQYTEGGGVQLRIHRDPLIPAYPILDKWVVSL